MLVAIPLVAETKEARAERHHEVRVGWGDQLFETLCWHEAAVSPTTVYPNYPETERTKFRYSQHWFVEYQYRVNRWFGVGGELDASGVAWREGAKKQNFYNLVIMPTARFTYLRHEYVGLYSGLGIGVDINGGTEVDLKGKHTAASMAVDITAIGLEVGHGNWFGAVEFGGLYAMKGRNMIYMAGSKLFRASIAYRF